MFIEPLTEYELQIEINNLNENKIVGMIKEVRKWKERWWLMQRIF